MKFAGEAPVPVPRPSCSPRAANIGDAQPGTPSVPFSPHRGLGPRPAGPPTSPRMYVSSHPPKASGAAAPTATGATVPPATGAAAPHATGAAAPTATGAATTTGAAPTTGAAASSVDALPMPSDGPGAFAPSNGGPAQCMFPPSHDVVFQPCSRPVTMCCFQVCPPRFVCIRPMVAMLLWLGPDHPGFSLSLKVLLSVIQLRAPLEDFVSLPGWLCFLVHPCLSLPCQLDRWRDPCGCQWWGCGE